MSPSSFAKGEGRGGGSLAKGNLPSFVERDRSVPPAGIEIPA